MLWRQEEDLIDHFIGDFDPARRRDAIENMRVLLSVIAELGGHGAIPPAAYGMFSRRLPPFEPPRSPEEDRAVLIEGLTALGEHAAREGVVVLFEPLNRYEDHMVNTLAQAVALCRAVALPTVRVMADVFHLHIAERDPAAAIIAAGDELRHGHLADSNRLQPGAGHLDPRPILAAPHCSGYDGYLALECRLAGEPHAALAGAAAYLRALLAPFVH
ncbi:sugar phosphate isomerase/epimerase family protein [Kallotenue papyrolyticum]|uniref:sugar phosphate isomerase/epimerase family protein n=1 Tax=Kallotenue papyrolyticum TaxID=1325125 RepID=UPI0004786532|nr:sugar phosphate isomerase/epimerase [Kallotenue papyrolyticum]